MAHRFRTGPGVVGDPAAPLGTRLPSPDTHHVATVFGRSLVGQESRPLLSQPIALSEE